MRAYDRPVRAGELNPFWRWGLAVVGPLVRLCFRVRVSGMERVPSAGPAILAFNHVSALDGPVLAIETGRRLRRETRYLVAAEYFAHGAFGWILRRTDQIAIRRGEGDVAALDTAIEEIRRGALAAIAPEGRVDDHGGEHGLQRIRSGVARIALPTGAPVIPVGIWGTQTRWPRRGLRLGRPWRPVVVLAFGPPILPVGDVEDPADVEAFVERIGEHLRTQVAHARRLADQG
jgi:1-acyl-sn-glycerol-3-phosphate acyltransferase